MYVKYTTTLINLASVHIKFEGNALIFSRSTRFLHPIVAHFDDEKIASFAYGRIIHGILLGWFCVDISPIAITKLMEKSCLHEPPHEYDD